MVLPSDFRLYSHRAQAPGDERLCNTRAKEANASA